MGGYQHDIKAKGRTEGNRLWPGGGKPFSPWSSPGLFPPPLGGFFSPPSKELLRPMSSNKGYISLTDKASRVDYYVRVIR